MTVNSPCLALLNWLPNPALATWHWRSATPSLPQVLTSNPLVESWGHFPQSRDRLLRLLHRTHPRGLVLLSGDVHHAELASGWRANPSMGADASGRTEDAPAPSQESAGDEDVCELHAAGEGRLEDVVDGRGRGVVEVTTSGMTHSCLVDHGKGMCEAYLSRWGQHRWRDDAYYL